MDEIYTEKKYPIRLAATLINYKRLPEDVCVGGSDLPPKIALPDTKGFGMKAVFITHAAVSDYPEIVNPLLEAGVFKVENNRKRYSVKVVLDQK
ncbi:MAG: hypothetical protein K9G62_07875 [Alphaproteobacteria bacterium]|nr:hypothetical protein [Alphaproteobacteria bacterium]